MDHIQIKFKTFTLPETQMINLYHEYHDKYCRFGHTPNTASGERIERKVGLGWEIMVDNDIST